MKNRRPIYSITLDQKIHDKSLQYAPDGNFSKLVEQAVKRVIEICETEEEMALLGYPVDMKLKHRDSTCPMYNTCSSLGWISENCSIGCYLDVKKK